MACHSLDVTKSLFFTLLLLFSTIGSAQAQVESVTVTEISAQLIGVKKVATGQTRSIPPTILYSITGYEYRIKLELHSTDLDLQTTPVLFLICFLPDQTIQTIPVARENIRTPSKDRYEYEFPLSIPKKGYTGFTVATENELPKKSRADYFSRLYAFQQIFLPRSSDVE